MFEADSERKHISTLGFELAQPFHEGRSFVRADAHVA
jgi:hypothetical protein